MLCFCFHVIHTLLNKKQTQDSCVRHGRCRTFTLFLHNYTDSRQDFHDCKWKGLYYFHNCLGLFHALMDILHDSYEPDENQRLGGTSPKKEKIMLVVSGDTRIHRIILPANRDEAVQALRDHQQTLLHTLATVSC